MHLWHAEDGALLVPDEAGMERGGWLSEAEAIGVFWRPPRSTDEVTQNQKLEVFQYPLLVCFLRVLQLSSSSRLTDDDESVMESNF
ncbi:hypothetical protein AVEN_15962-1 [Araneus ventricosus]|uniref:Uncharacterized protein n=1 Tax=Araneus ventricosus TaxID=182803 RepID=A0A4Y2IDJ2_ARAVE|nr:hypothetical protein AVEN_15962-1 [Araneus ventricosus]